MIIFPRKIRKIHQIQQNSEMFIVKLEGVLTKIPIRDIESTRDINIEEFEKSIEEAQDLELELENKIEKCFN